MRELIHDLVVMENVNDDCVDTDHDKPNEAAKKIYNLLMNAEKELYPGCKEFSKLEFIVNLLQLKCHGILYFRLYFANTLFVNIYSYDILHYYFSYHISP